MIDYQELASEYFSEADKITRNIDRLVAILAESQTIQRHLIVKKIKTLKRLRHECLLTAIFLEHRAEEIRQRSVN